MLTEHRAAFCARLKAAREEKGVSLDQIAASTKIPASLFRGLERNDLSRWPGGLFRRSYLRDYLRALGLPTDPTVAEFLRLFPDPDGEAPCLNGSGGSLEDPPSPLSLTLADGRSDRAARVRTRIVAAAIDAAIVIGASLAVALALHTDPGASMAGVALAYYSMATVSLGRGVGARWIADRRVARWKRGAPAPPRSQSSVGRKAVEQACPAGAA